MRRKRYQKGSVRPRKHGRHKVWVGQWWEQGQRKSRVLGRCADMPKSEAESRLAVILKPFNEGAGQSQKPIYTFGVYLEEIFLPGIRRKWKESTRVTTEPRMRYHLLPSLGGCLLQQITRERMQASWIRRRSSHLAAPSIICDGTSIPSSRWRSATGSCRSIQPGLFSLRPASRKEKSEC